MKTWYVLKTKDGYNVWQERLPQNEAALEVLAVSREQAVMVMQKWPSLADEKDLLIAKLTRKVPIWHNQALVGEKLWGG